jgi:hypothetical protein
MSKITVVVQSSTVLHADGAALFPYSVYTVKNSDDIENLISLGLLEEIQTAEEQKDDSKKNPVKSTKPQANEAQSQENVNG